MRHPSYGRLRVALAALCLSASACSGGDDGGGDSPPGADASPLLTCSKPDEGAEAFELRVGMRVGADQAFTQLADGDPAPLVLGYQGLFMLQLTSEAALPLDEEELCLHCAAELGPSTSTSFEGSNVAANIPFEVVQSGAYRGSITFILGSGSDEAKFDGAQVKLTATCGREGFAGSLERSLTLQAP